MDSSFWSGTIPLAWYNKLGIDHCTYLEVSGYNFQNLLYPLSENLFTFTKSVNPDEMQIMLHSIWVFTNCKRIFMEFPENKGLKTKIYFFPCMQRFLSPAYNLWKQFGYKSGPTEHQYRSRSKLYDTLLVLLNFFL